MRDNRVNPSILYLIYRAARAIGPACIFFLQVDHWSYIDGNVAALFKATAFDIKDCKLYETSRTWAFMALYILAALALDAWLFN